jgi:hypothetical protein
MKRLVFLFLLMPLCVFAHGEEVLTAVFNLFYGTIAFILFIFLLKKSIKIKLLVAGIYVLSVVVLVCTIGTLPYFKNKTLVDICFAIGPLIITFLFYLAFVRRIQDRSHQ